MQPAGASSSAQQKHPSQQQQDPSQQRQLVADGQVALQEDFEPSTSFAGAREGYVYTTGAQGTGYYKDDPLHLRGKAAAKPKPAVLKRNSIVTVKPASLPDAKKRKTGDAGASKPAYLKEMDRYNAMNCSSNTQHDRPLVK